MICFSDYMLGTWILRCETNFAYLFHFGIHRNDFRSYYICHKLYTVFETRNESGIYETINEIWNLNNKSKSLANKT